MYYVKSDFRAITGIIGHRTDVNGRDHGRGLKIETYCPLW